MTCYGKHLQRGPLEERAHAAHDFAGAFRPGRFAQLPAEPSRDSVVLGQPTQARVCGGDDGCERLIHLVGNGCGEFADGRRLRRSRELRLRPTQRFLDALAILDVDEETLPLRWLAGARAMQLPGHIKPSVYAVCPPQSVLVLEG